MASIKLLLHCDGVDGSQVFPDDSVSNHAMTAHGNVQVDTAQKKWGTGSGLFDGTGDYLSALDHADWNISANFTIDLWVKHVTPNGFQVYISQYENDNNFWVLRHWGDPIGNGLLFGIRSGGANIVLTSEGGKISDTSWHHIAMCKVGNAYGIYLDGNQVCYVSDASIDTFAGQLLIGQYSNDFYFNGRMDEIRITHANPFGAAPNSGKTDTIIVPSGPYDASSSSSSNSLSSSSSSISSSSSRSSSSLSGSPSSSSSSSSLSSSSSSNSSSSSSSFSSGSVSSSSSSQSSSSISFSSASLITGVLPVYEPTGIVDVYLDAGTRHFATRDIYVNDVYYKGTLLDAPQIIQALSDLYYGVEQSTSVTLRFANGDDGVDDTWDDIVVTNGDEPRNREVRVQRYDPSDGITFEFRGRITSYSLGSTVELVVEMRDEAILETLLPSNIVTTDEFTTTALNLGEPINLCFGHCRNVTLRNIQNNITTDRYDYLIGYGTLESLWVDHANGLGVKRDGVLVDTAEYVFYDGSQGAPYNGYAFLRFTVEQMNFSGGFHNLTADVKGLELGGATAERNFATVIRNILSNTTWGLSESVDAASFVFAANDLDSIGDMYCDGSVTSQRQARDIIDDLLFPARGRIWRASDGEWEIKIDTAGVSVLNIGDNDGFYNNAEVIKAYATPTRDALQTAVVHYSLNPSDENPFKEMSVAVHTGFGLAKTYELPFVLEDDTAERVLSYLKNRSIYSDERITVRVGMEGRHISRGSIVTVTAPSRNIAAKAYIVEQTTKSLTDFLWECREYSANIYNNEVIASPSAPVRSDRVVVGPTSLVSTTNVGDGSALTGSLTMYVPPGQGDSYLAGGSFDLAAWKADHGFLIGIDDSDGDRAKTYIGNLRSYQDWNGVRLAQRLDREANTFIPYADEADQGATGSGKSAKAYIDSIGANDGTLVFTHDGTGATTTYTFSTNETIPSNINVIIENGAVLNGASTLTINKFSDPGLIQCFGSTITIAFGANAVGFVRPEWWEVDGTADEVQINAANDSLPAVGGIIQGADVTYSTDAFIELDSGTTLRGVNSRATKIVPSVTMTNIIQAAASATDVHLEDLWVYGTDTSGVTERGFFSDDGTDIYIEGCRFDRMTYAIQLQTVLRGTVTNNLINDTAGVLGTTFGYGVLCNLNCDHISVVDNKFKSINRHAVYFSSGTSNSIAAFNEIDGAGESAIGIYAKDTQNPCVNNKIIGNFVENVVSAGNDGHGIVATDYVLNVSIIGNTLHTINDYGIYLQSASDGTDNTKMLIDALVRGNSVIDSSDGIKVNNGQGVSIVGNKVVNTSAHGIHITHDGVAATSILDRILIDGNSLEDIGDDGIRIVGGPEETNITLGINEFTNITGKEITQGAGIVGMSNKASPIWVEDVITFDDFDAAAAVIQHNFIRAFAVGEIISEVWWWLDTEFSGGGATAATLEMGRVGVDDDGLFPAENVFTGAGVGLKDSANSSRGVYLWDPTAGDTHPLNFFCTGARIMGFTLRVTDANGEDLTQGQARVWVKYEQMRFPTG